jgi:hypothetical protein
MATCPNGHPNPARWEFCGECGAPIDDFDAASTDRVWYRSMRTILAAGVFAVLVAVGAVAGLVIGKGAEQTNSSMQARDGSAAIQEWWSGAYQHFTDLQTALDDSRRASKRLDEKALEAACQQIHDTAGVDLPAHLPTPDPQLSSELKAATDDAHAAAHMCLSVIAGSMNSYVAEFVTDVDQAERHLTAAQAIINNAITESRPAAP